jgi:hypothetical protein
MNAQRGFKVLLGQFRARSIWRDRLFFRDRLNRGDC